MPGCSMPNREASLLDIITYARRVSNYVAGIDRDDFVSSTGVQDQVIRCLSVIGEAAKRTPEDVRDRYPEVPWTQIIGMRNRLAHEYDGLDMDAVWLTATADIPAILQALRAVRKERP